MSFRESGNLKSYPLMYIIVCYFNRKFFINKPIRAKDSIHHLVIIVVVIFLLVLLWRSATTGTIACFFHFYVLMECQFFDYFLRFAVTASACSASVLTITPLTPASQICCSSVSVRSQDFNQQGFPDKPANRRISITFSMSMQGCFPGLQLKTASNGRS